MELLDLPSELLLKIFENTPAPSCVRCRQVCRSLKSLIDEESPTIQYKIELFAADMVDSPSCNMPISARLEALRAYQKAWWGLNWTNHLQLSIDHATWEIVGDTLAMVDRSGKFVLQTIPSTLRGQRSGRQWSFGTGIRINVFAMDPFQDLLVFLGPVEGGPMSPSVSVHILSLKNGVQHPSASWDRPMKLPLHMTAHYTGPFYLTICGPYVAVTCFDSRSSAPLVFSWKTGIPLPLNPDVGSEIQDVAFIDERYLLLGVKANPSELRVPKFSLLIHDLQEDCAVCELNFPTAGSAGYRRITLTFDYPTSYTTSMHAFAPPPDDRAFGISVGGEIFYIQLSSLRRFILQSGKPPLCLAVEPESWISESAVVSHGDGGRIFAFGKRFGVLEARTNSLTVVDINSRAIRRQQSLALGTERNGLSTVQSTNDPLVFEHLTSKSLPFNMVTKELPMEIETWGSVIIALNPDAILLAQRSGIHLLSF